MRRPIPSTIATIIVVAVIVGDATRVVPRQIDAVANSKSTSDVLVLGNIVAACKTPFWLQG